MRGYPCDVQVSNDCSVTFLLQSQLSLGLNVLQGCSQVPGQTAGAVGCQQGALLGQSKCQTGSYVEKEDLRLQ